MYSNMWITNIITNIVTNVYNPVLEQGKRNTLIAICCWVVGIFTIGLLACWGIPKIKEFWNNLKGVGSSFHR